MSVSPSVLVVRPTFSGGGSGVLETYRRDEHGGDGGSGQGDPGSGAVGGAEPAGSRVDRGEGGRGESREERDADGSA